MQQLREIDRMKRKRSNDGARASRASIIIMLVARALKLEKREKAGRR